MSAPYGVATLLEIVRVTGEGRVSGGAAASLGVQLWLMSPPVHQRWFFAQFVLYLHSDLKR